MTIGNKENNLDQAYQASAGELCYKAQKKNPRNVKLM